MDRLARSFAIAAILVTLTGSVFAHSQATGVVKERMDEMTALAAAVKKLAGMVKTGKADRTEVLQIANELKAHSGQTLLNRFS